MQGQAATRGDPSPPPGGRPSQRASRVSGVAITESDVSSHDLRRKIGEDQARSSCAVRQSSSYGVR